MSRPPWKRAYGERLSDRVSHGYASYEVCVDKRRRFAPVIEVRGVTMFATGRRADVGSYKFSEYEDPTGRTRAAEYRADGCLPIWAFADGTVLEDFDISDPEDE